MKTKTIIKIEITHWNLKVGRRYYSFDYKVKINGVEFKAGSYDTSHSRSPQFIRKWMTGGGVEEVLLRQIYG